MSSSAREAKYWHVDKGRVVCTACPRHCAMAEGQNGFCFVRKNEGGRLATLAYGQPNAVAVDPIEKKPLFHFLPGTTILSIGTAGCNLGCRFCQNWDLSRARSNHMRAMSLPPSEVARLATSEGCASVAFTYSDPTVFVEYATDAAIACREAGLATVAVTAGYIGKEAREDLYRHLDAANIDLKGFTEDFYAKLSLAHLAPVLETIEYAVKHGVFVELTTLLIPGHNDGEDEIRAESKWVVEHLGPDVPLHFSAFHPAYQLLNVPRTPPQTLRRARAIALAEGVRYVYVGNLVDEEGETTYCHGCGEPLIGREGFAVRHNLLAGNDHCPKCQAIIPGVFDARARTASAGIRHGLL
ncbi:MAG: AmmeMemoRadiSam system radical SAM enzyme [Deltaproteobacteria bacterium]|nr:AmmeMemoRadiSam system radical SAM enzyme [Deltaproteobacteria bacterium]